MKPCANPACDRHLEPPGAVYKGKRGLCARCYYRWAGRGFPPEGPGQPRHERTSPETAAALREDYALLRSTGVPRDVAAVRVGVVRSTARKYERLLEQDHQREGAAA
jgi:hypothetical protein